MKPKLISESHRAVIQQFLPHLFFPSRTQANQQRAALGGFAELSPVFPKSQAPPEGLRMAFVPTSANAPSKQGAKTFTETQHAVSSKEAIE